jgi:putative addiction module CopG family antidote
MSIRINLPSELADFVQEKLENGRYRNADEAIADALRLMKQRDEAECQRLRILLAKRMQDADRGNSVPFDAKLRKQIRQRGTKRLAALRRSRSA